MGPSPNLNHVEKRKVFDLTEAVIPVSIGQSIGNSSTDCAIRPSTWEPIRITTHYLNNFFLPDLWVRSRNSPVGIMTSFVLGSRGSIPGRGMAFLRCSPSES